MSLDFFELGIEEAFRPLAFQNRLPFRKLHDGVYEMIGKEFAMRIRRGTGHGKGFLITLSRRRDLSHDPLDLTGEVGLGVLAEFDGDEALSSTLGARDVSPKAFRSAAAAAAHFCLPYVLGKRSDFDDVRQFVEQKNARSRAEARDYEFPPNVRKEWI